MCRDQGVRRVKLAFVGLPVGSTSAFLSALGLAFGTWEPIGAAGRAAAALGIYTDTSALLHGATPLDFRMFEKLTRDPETSEILDDLRDYRVPPEWQAYRAAAFRNIEMTGTVRIAPVGYVRSDHRDVIAEIANELLRIEGTSIGIAVAVTEQGTEASIRGDARLLNHDPERIVRVVEYLLNYAFPGVSGFKYERRPPHRVEGGACVRHSEAQERLWTLGAMTPGRRGRPGPGSLPHLRPGPHRRPSGPEVRPPRGDPGAAVVDDTRSSRRSCLTWPESSDEGGCRATDGSSRSSWRARPAATSVSWAAWARSQ